MPRNQYRKRALTVIEILVVIAVVIVIAAVLLPVIGSHACGGRGIKDSSQIRGVVQAMAIWANNNKDQYPLPSSIDLADDTVPEPGRAKDTSANIMSLLIYNGSVPTELLVSPAEANPDIQQCTGYEFNAPKAAVRPEKALWDPAFNADFTSKTPGGLSYAHQMPSDERLKFWANSFAPTDPILGNRGPEIASVKKLSPPRVSATVRDPNTNTFLIHGSRSAWEGNIAYNDAHVDFTTAFDDSIRSEGQWGTYVGADGTRWGDVLFFDEPDDPSASNAFLGIFTTAGATAHEFNAIWD